MASEYETLVEKLKATGIPFEEYGWETRPEGIYGVITPDMEAGSTDADGDKLDKAIEASIDVFFSRLCERKNVIRTVEDVLRKVCGSSWWLNSSQHETKTKLFHFEWVCQVFGEIDGEAEAGDA